MICNTIAFLSMQELKTVTLNPIFANSLKIGIAADSDPPDPLFDKVVPSCVNN
jgi:hypothetical protein